MSPGFWASGAAATTVWLVVVEALELGEGLDVVVVAHAAIGRQTLSASATRPP
jgi:hypothetical protein